MIGPLERRWNLVSFVCFCLYIANWKTVTFLSITILDIHFSMEDNVFREQRIIFTLFKHSSFLLWPLSLNIYRLPCQIFGDSG